MQQYSTSATVVFIELCCLVWLDQKHHPSETVPSSDTLPVLDLLDVIVTRSKHKHVIVARL